MTDPSSERQWQARWIWTPGATNPGIHFSYFRTTIHVANRVTEATLSCTADSKYRLWVNGSAVGVGPARGTAQTPYYDSYTIPLHPGENTIAALVEHYTCTGGGIFDKVEGGWWCQVDAGGVCLAATDERWKARTAEAYWLLPGHLFTEGFDARREPEGWEGPEFDDRAWEDAVVLRDTRLAPPSAFRPRPVPPIPSVRRDPGRILALGTCVDEECTDLANLQEIAHSLWRCRLAPPRAGQFSPAITPYSPWSGVPLSVTLLPGESAYLMIDFALNILASPYVEAEGPAGAIIDLGYSECLDQNRVATRWQQHSHAERIMLREGMTRHRSNQPRGYQFLMLRFSNPGEQPAVVTLHTLYALEEIYPAKPMGSFTSSDPRLEPIFRLATRTLNLCMEDVYTDCPWRERRLWLGDLQPEALFGYYAFGAYDLARHCVEFFTRCITPEGWLPGFIPLDVPDNYPTWGLRYPVIAWEYFLHTGDAETLQLSYAAVHKFMAWIAGYANAEGLLLDLPGCLFTDWNVLDWQGLGDGVIQGWYLDALQHSAQLAEAAGDAQAATDFTARAGVLRDTLARLYWSDTRQAFRKYRPGSPARLPEVDPELIGQHENVLFPLLGVGTPEMRRRALQAIRGATGYALPELGGHQSAHLAVPAGNYLGETILRIGSPFWSCYALQALLEAGEAITALQYLRICWGMMLDNGANTCWEMWDRHTSLCHGWSAAPALILPAYVLGVRPTTPGFRDFLIAPQPGDLTWAQGTVPTPHGLIELSWRRGGEKLTLTVTVPPGTTAHVKLGEAPEQVLASGQHELSGTIAAG